MDIRTHKKISQKLCGKAVQIEDGFSRVELTADDDMAADESGLVHGGFIFGLADYAAMIAVNHPNVVLGAADVRFKKPVRVSETVIANAKVTSVKGKKQMVSVTVQKNEDIVFEGEFTCFVLEKHVLMP